jgi:hypothetical protein
MRREARWVHYGVGSRFQPFGINDLEMVDLDIASGNQAGRWLGAIQALWLAA